MGINRNVWYGLILFSSFLLSCKSGTDYINLKKVSSTEKLEIDTIEAYPQRGLYIINIIRYGFLGSFSSNYGIIKTINSNKNIVYEFDGNNNEGGRVSNDFIAYVKPFGVTNWGWFYVKNGKVSDKLPNIDRILDSLQSIDKGFYIKETNGYISFYKDSKIIKSVNYGNVIMKNKQNLDSLKYKLYQLIDNDLKVVSNHADDLFKRKEGLYFIPSPGYGVIRKFNKQEIFKIIDSVSKLQNPPEKISVKAR